MTTADAVIQYLRKHSPVHTGVEWRINYVSDATEGILYNLVEDGKTSTAPVSGMSIALIVLSSAMTKFLT